jgi:pSer/pThr/pTyr-binding forkhead associated (FHA) protein
MTEGIHAGHIFRLLPDDTLVGRDPYCDIVVDDPAVSRQHAKVRVVEREDKQKAFVIHDLATENGTFVNGEEIAKHELDDGDIILVGETELVFKQVRQQAQKS